MDRKDKLDYEKGMEEYFHKKKVYDLIEKLFEELIINKPKNPIDYLIARLKKKTIKRIFITGYEGTNSKEIAVNFANSLNYSSANISSLIDEAIAMKDENSQYSELKKENRYIDDELIIDLIKRKIIKFEEENKSYVIEGFPKNRTQAIFLQSMGILPDNVIVFKTNKENAENGAFTKIKNRMKKDNLTDEEIKSIANTLESETEMNIRALEDVFQGFYEEINVDNYSSETEIIQELARLFVFKEKVSAERNPPKIVLVAPPSFNKNQIIKLVANQLKIIPINIMDLLRKEIGAKNENSKIVLNSVENYDLVDDKYVLKLLEDRLYCSDCMINGWIVTGFPKSNLQINYMEKMSSEIKPSLIVVINTSQEVIIEKAKKLKSESDNNPQGPKQYNKLVGNIVQGLAKRRQNEEELLQKRIDEWKVVSDILLKKNYENLISLDGKESDSKIAELIVKKTGFD